MSTWSDLGLKMTDVEANQGTAPLPIGRHTLRVERYSAGETSEASKLGGGHLAYKVALIKVGGERDGTRVWDSIPMAGDRLNDNMGKLRALLEACGITEDDMAKKGFDPGSTATEEQLTGKLVDAELSVTKPSANFPNPGNMVQSYHEHEFADADLDVS